MSNESVNDFGLYFVGDTYRTTRTVNFQEWDELQVHSRAKLATGKISLWSQWETLGNLHLYLPHVPPRLMEQSGQNVWYIEPDFSYIMGTAFSVDLEVDEYSCTTADNVEFEMGYESGFGEEVWVNRLTEEQPKLSDSPSIRIAQKEADVPPDSYIKWYSMFKINAWGMGVTGLTLVNSDETLQDSPYGFTFDADTIRQLGKSTVKGTLNQFLSDGLITEILTQPRFQFLGGQDVPEGFLHFGKDEL